MSILASDILTGTYQILGRPSLQDLPYLDMLAIVRDVARGRMLDLKLAARNHTVQVGSWVTPTGREMTTAGYVGGLENFIPVKVEWRYLAESGLTPEVMPRRVEVVAMEQLNAVDGGDYCAFYDAFQNIAFSLNESALSLRQYRITYEDTSDITITATTHTVDLPDIFVPLCKYETGLLCLDQIRNPDPIWADERERLRVIFLAEFQRWDARFKKFTTSLYGNKIVSKRGAGRRQIYRRTY